MLVGDGARDAAGARAQVGHEQRRGIGPGIVRGSGGGAGAGDVRRARSDGSAAGRSASAACLAAAGRESSSASLRSCASRGARGCAAGRRRERLAHQHLGLGARDEHAGAHLHRDMAETHLAGDVLQRLAPAAARTRSRAACRARPATAAARVRCTARCGDSPHASASSHSRRQARVLVALALKVAHRPVERGLDGPDVVVQPWSFHRPVTGWRSQSARTACRHPSIRGIARKRSVLRYASFARSREDRALHAVRSVGGSRRSVG